MRITYRFVAQGTSAPDPLPPATLWADVGNGGDPAVLDHHQGAPESCAAAMVVSHADMLARRFGDLDELTIVTHHAPDLDAVAACWLAARLLNGPGFPLGADELVAEIGRHDQGLADRGAPSGSLGLVAALVLDETPDDLSRLHAGFALLERVAARLAAGEGLRAAVAASAGPELHALLAQAAREYDADAAGAAWTRLVVAGHEAPAAHFVSPRSALLKHFYRHDHPRAVLAVSWPLAGDEWRHIVSVEADSGLALPGLGAALEAAERAAEEGRALRPGRERVPLGQGRFGGDVVSPWYDGRGHSFTIIDSPSVGAPDRCASLLPPGRVWAALCSLYAKEAP